MDFCFVFLNKEKKKIKKKINKKKMTWISTSVLYMPHLKLYILAEQIANDVKFISVDREKLDLSKNIYLWYRKFYICRDTALFYEHKK